MRLKKDLKKEFKFYLKIRSREIKDWEKINGDINSKEQHNKFLRWSDKNSYVWKRLKTHHIENNKMEIKLLKLLKIEETILKGKLAENNLRDNNVTSKGYALHHSVKTILKQQLLSIKDKIEAIEIV